MKNNLKLITVFSCALLMSLASCKKYEEGPGFSLRSKMGRLVNDWKLDELKVEGTDYTSAVNKWQITFDKDLEFDQTFQENGSASFTTKGEWEFSNDKEEIEITYDSGDKLDLEILRLTKGELWFEFTQDYEDGTSEKWECKFESK